MTELLQNPVDEAWDKLPEFDRGRWWIREGIYSASPKTPLSIALYNDIWDEVWLWSGEQLSIVDCRALSVRTLGGYTYIGPLPLPDLTATELEERAREFEVRAIEAGEAIRDGRDDLLREQREALGRWKAIDLRTSRLLDLVYLWREVVCDFERFMKIHFTMAIPRHCLVWLLQEHLEAVPEEARPDVKRLVQGMGLTTQVKLDMELWRLAGAAVEAGISRDFTDTTPTELRGRLAASKVGREWLIRFDEFLGEFGHRATVPKELREPLWIESPETALSIVASYVEKGGPFDFDGMMRELDEDRATALGEVLSHVRAPERAKIERLADLARLAQAAMEDDNYYYMWIGAQARLVAREIGARLQAASHVEHGDDVFFLDSLELQRFVRDAVTGYDVGPTRELIAARRLEFLRQRNCSPPLMLGDVPEAIDNIILTMFWGFRFRAQLEGIQDASLTGVSGSAGEATGLARVVLTDADFSKVQPGDILVCPATTSSWTPLFSKIAGIVTDQGGTLSHAAVVAREYGVPAVLATLKATVVITDGATVHVDGTNGKVSVL